MTLNELSSLPLVSSQASSASSSFKASPVCSGSRAFALAVPIGWPTVPHPHICTAPSLTSFKFLLKCNLYEDVPVGLSPLCCLPSH